MKQSEIDVILNQRKSDRMAREIADPGCRVDNNIELDHTNLSGLDLHFTDLRNASMYSADLRNANLASARLQGALLFKADLTGADMENCLLHGADLERAIGIVRLDMVDPREYHPIAVNHGGAWRIYSGCWSFTVPEALAHWSNPEYDGDPEIAARYVRAINALPECPQEES